MNTKPLPKTPPAARGRLAMVIPCLNEAENLAVLLPKLRQLVVSARLPAQLFVVDCGSKDGSQETARHCGAEVIVSLGEGYGIAIFTAIQYLPAEYLLTLDADLSEPEMLVEALYAARDSADVVVASRYAPGGRAETSCFRNGLSRWLNRVLGRRLDLAVRDVTSGYRIYRRAAVMNVPLRHEDFAVLPELLARAQGHGATIAEIPFTYRPRRSGNSNARLRRFAAEYVPLLLGWVP